MANDASVRDGEASLSQRKDLVDEAFQDLYGFPWGTTFQLQSDTSDCCTKEKLDETTQILVEMLGRTSAARILRYTDRVVSAKRVPIVPQPQTEWTMLSEQPPAVSPRSTQNLTTTASSPDKKQTVHKKEQHVKHRIGATEGSTLPATRSSTTSDTSVPAVQRNQLSSTKTDAKVVTGMDQLLQQFQDTGKVSTIAKTSSDWDQFKEQSGLGERLEEQADSNTSYLQKQDFLSRVDQRTFQVERREREQNRAKREK